MICCHLHLKRLHQGCPSYEAFSYVWGNAFARKAEIMCNGKVLKVTPNLKDALQRLRLKTCSRLVWVDAICINQDDTQERGHQVQMMSSIYEGASRVIVWLGANKDYTTPRALSVICSIVNSWHYEMYGTRPATFVTSTYSGKSINESPSPKDFGLWWAASQIFNLRWSWRIWAGTSMNKVPSPMDFESWWAVSQLFNLHWFWRLWVIQEVALNSSVLVIWGDSEISWKWIGLAAALIRTNHYQFLERFHPAGVYNAYFMYRISTGKDAVAPLFLSFHQLLGLTRQFEATDPRDRIFALLGLRISDTGRGDMFIQPDYKLSAEDLYKKVARQILLRSGSLEILSSVQHSAFSLLGKNQQLPSWVPNWNRAFVHTLSPWASEQHSADRGCSPKRIDFDGTDILLVNGVEVDIISEVLPLMSGKDFLPISLRNSGPLRHYFQTEAGIRLLSRTMTAGKDWYGRLIADSDSHVADFAAYLLQPVDPGKEFFISPIVSLYRQILAAHQWHSDLYIILMLLRHVPTILSEWFQKWWQGELRRKYDLRALGRKGDVDRFLQAASTTCIGRRLFVTTGGYLGLGPEAITEGDRVCILFGGSVPFVLRSEDNRDKLVGECYVEKLMRGEAVEERRLGTMKVKLFKLH
jgi:Heterokaryon incompatibility protein (HET)